MAEGKRHAGRIRASTAGKGNQVVIPSRASPPPHCSQPAVAAMRTAFSNGPLVADMTRYQQAVRARVQPSCCGCRRSVNTRVGRAGRKLLVHGRLRANCRGTPRPCPIPSPCVLLSCCAGGGSGPVGPDVPPKVCAGGGALEPAALTLRLETHGQAAAGQLAGPARLARCGAVAPARCPPPRCNSVHAGLCVRV